MASWVKLLCCACYQVDMDSRAHLQLTGTQPVACPACSSRLSSGKALSTARSGLGHAAQSSTSSRSQSCTNVLCASICRGRGRGGVV